MDDGLADRTDVPWAEARELLALVLLIAATSYVAGPLVQQLSLDNQGGFWEDLRQVLRNINVASGLLLVGSALTISVTPRGDRVAGLTRTIRIVALLVTLFGIVAMINVLTARSASSSVFLRIGFVMTASGPGTLLAGLAAWTVDRVDIVSR